MEAYESLQYFHLGEKQLGVQEKMFKYPRNITSV